MPFQSGFKDKRLPNTSSILFFQAVKKEERGLYIEMFCCINWKSTQAFKTSFTKPATIWQKSVGWYDNNGIFKGDKNTSLTMLFCDSQVISLMMATYAEQKNQANSCTHFSKCIPNNKPKALG